MVNNIAPLRTARIKNKKDEYFDREIAKESSVGLLFRTKGSSFSRTTKQKHFINKYKRRN